MQQGHLGPIHPPGVSGYGMACLLPKVRRVSTISRRELYVFREGQENLLQEGLLQVSTTNLLTRIVLHVLELDIVAFCVCVRLGAFQIGTIIAAEISQAWRPRSYQSRRATRQINRCDDRV